MRKCLILLCSQNFWKGCVLVYQEKLSLIISPGRPKLKKNIFSSWIVVVAAALQKSMASIHLEWTSMITKNWNPSISANSMCNRFMGSLAHGQLCSGTTGGSLCCAAHSIHILTTYFFNVAIYLWPWHIPASKQFHLNYPCVCKMQLLEQPGS